MLGQEAEAHLVRVRGWGRDRFRVRDRARDRVRVRDRVRDRVTDRVRDGVRDSSGWATHASMRVLYVTLLGGAPPLRIRRT